MERHREIPPPTLCWSDEWCIERAGGGELVLGAGADRRVATDGLARSTLAAVRRWAATGTVVADDDETRRLVDSLVVLGAVRVPGAPVGAVELRVAGSDPDADRRAAAFGGLAEFAAALRGHELDVVAEGRGHRPSRGAGQLLPTSEAADPLVVVLRVGDGPVVADTTHLAVDLRLHHTVVIGPLVVPGVTACVGCLDQRMARRWATAPVPPRPAIVGLLPAVAALTAVQVRLALAGTSCLANATATWDLERGTSAHEPLWKLPGCAVCDAGRSIGRVELPWSPPLPEVLAS